MKENIRFDYYNRQIFCYINDKYVGVATCHPDDMDMFSQRTGENIAYLRAKIKMYQDEKRAIKLQLKSINHLYSTIKDSKYYNVNGYVENRINNHIQYYNNDLLCIDEDINYLKESLSNYLKQMNEFFPKVRKLRSKE